MPADSMGWKCGIDCNVSDKRDVMYFNLIDCIDNIFDCKTPQVCVERCPNTLFHFSKDECESSSFNEFRDKLICQKHINIDQIHDCYAIEERIEMEDCARWYLPSKSCK